MFHSYTHLKKTSEQLHSFGCFVLRIIRSHLCTRLQKKNPKIIKTNFYCLILHNPAKNTMQSMKYNLEYNVHNLISHIYQEFSQSTLNTVELQECFDFLYSRRSTVHKKIGRLSIRIFSSKPKKIATQ
jgi:hypothetical protein